MRISDGSTDECSSDLTPVPGIRRLNRSGRAPARFAAWRWNQRWRRCLKDLPKNILTCGGGSLSPRCSRFRSSWSPCCVTYGWDSVTSCRMARSEEHTSELQSLMRISYAVFCLKKKNTNIKMLINVIHVLTREY